MNKNKHLVKSPPIHYSRGIFVRSCRKSSRLQRLSDFLSRARTKHRTSSATVKTRYVSCLHTEHGIERYGFNAILQSEIFL